MEPPVHQPEKRRARRGCLVVLGVLAALAVVAALAIAFFAWRFLRTPDGKRLLAGVEAAQAAAAEGLVAPGTEELRALGCQQAIVTNTERIAVAISGTEGRSSRSPTDLTLVVVCSASLLGGAPSCDDVARTYVAALGGRAAGPFAVVVNGLGGARCQDVYDATGAKRASTSPPGR